MRGSNRHYLDYFRGLSKGLVALMGYLLWDYFFFFLRIFFCVEGLEIRNSFYIPIQKSWFLCISSNSAWKPNSSCLISCILSYAIRRRQSTFQTFCLEISLADTRIFCFIDDLFVNFFLLLHSSFTFFSRLQ